MALNVFGPYGAGVNPATVRPSDTGEPGEADTFFAPCSSPTARDGTVVSYRWLNKMLATLRRATRGMGIADDPASDELLLEAIKRGATLANVGTGTDIYQGQNAAKAHLIRKLAAGSNVTLTLVEGPTGEYAIRIAATAVGSGPTGNTIGNVGDGADVYKGTNGTVEELRGIKGLGPVGIAVNGDNVEVGLVGAAWTMLLRASGTTGQGAYQTVHSLTERVAPANADVLLLQRADNNNFEKVRVDTLRNTGVSVVAAGIFNFTTGASSLTINSQTISGGTVAQAPGDPSRARLTFSAPLADARYVVTISHSLAGASDVQALYGDKTTSKLDFWIPSAGTISGDIQFVVHKIA